MPYTLFPCEESSSAMVFPNPEEAPVMMIILLIFSIVCKLQRYAFFPNSDKYCFFLPLFMHDFWHHEPILQSHFATLSPSSYSDIYSVFSPLFSIWVVEEYNDSLYPILGHNYPSNVKNIPSKHFFRPKQSFFCIKCDLVFAHFSDQNGVIIYLPPFPRTFFEHTAPLSYLCFLCPSVWQAPASMCIHHCIINRLSILYHCSLTRLSLLYFPSILSFLLQRYSATVRIWDLYFLFYDLNIYRYIDIDI